MENEPLYYIHELIPYALEHNEEIGKYQVVLLQVQDDKTEDIVPRVIIQEKLLFHKENEDYFLDNSHSQAGIYEGCFVQLDSNDNIINANKNKRAKKLLLLNNVARGKIMKLEEEPSQEHYESITNVRSYHINVGHGNMSLIVFTQNKTTHIWMIDCSWIEIRTGNSYKNHVDACFEHIKSVYHLAAIKFDKILITHIHYDHISTLEKMLSPTYLAIGFELWLNLAFSSGSQTYGKILNKLLTMSNRPHIINPIRRNSIHHINILFPDFIIRGTKSGTVGQAPGGKINNSSVIYEIRLAGKSMIFPGDVETAGWNLVNDCCPFDNMTNYYCVSHHGSITGHTRNQCPRNVHITDIRLCTSYIRQAILMGRDGLFHGIISPAVRNCFASKLSITSDMNGKNPTKFLELDWNTGIINRY